MPGSGGPRGRRTAFVAVVAMLAVFLAPPPVRADGPQFLESGPLVIPERQLTDPGFAGQVIEVVNSASAEPLTVQVRVTGALSDALVVQPPASATVSAGGTVQFRLVRGPNPHRGTGELVVIAAGGLDRRLLEVTAPPAGFWHRFGRAAAGSLVLVLAVSLAVWLLARRRRRSAAVRPPAPARVLPDSVGGVVAEFLHSDEPTEDDHLDRDEHAATLARLAREGQPPLVVGVFGEWGSGKTSLLMQVRKKLRSDETCALAWFEPWRFQHDENPVLPLLHAVVNDLDLESAQDVRRALSVISRTLGSMALSATARMTVADVKTAIDQYDEANFRLRSERTRLNDHFSDLVRHALAQSGRSRLVVFVDDLDRCGPEQILGLLEALKLYLNRRDCIFFLAVDSDRLARVVSRRYGETGDDGTDYLEKIVQVPFRMPRLSEAAFHRYVDELLTAETADAASVVKVALRRNPRAIRRFVNALVLQDYLARTRGVSPYHISVLATVLLLRQTDAAFYTELERDSSLLRRVLDDMETAADGTGNVSWSEPVVALVRALTDSGVRIPDDVADYIDLAAASDGQLSETDGRRRLTAAQVRELAGEPSAPADLSGADLHGEDLSGIVLRGALLRGADLTEAVLRGTDLRGADLSGARWSFQGAVEAANVGGALIDQSTTLPDGTPGPPPSTTEGPEEPVGIGRVPSLSRAELIRLARAPLATSSRETGPYVELRLRLRPDLAPGLRLGLEYPEDPVIDAAGLITLIDETAHDVLILGEPGSGKTVLLRRLAEQLLRRAETDLAERVPLILPLAGWTAENRTPFAGWAVGVMGDLYRIPPASARQLLDGGQLTVLLDGLDEVAPKERHRCADEIRNFRKRNPQTGLVLTARAAEYAESAARLNFRAVLEVLPLTEDDVRAYLAEVLPGAERLHPQRTGLLAASSSPLMLSLAAAALRDASEPPTSAEDVVRFTVEASLRRLASMTKLGRDRASATLSLLARHLYSTASTAFDTEDSRVRAALREGGVRGQDVPRFIQAAAECGLLVQIRQSTFSFRHRLIMDYFRSETPPTD